MRTDFLKVLKHTVVYGLGKSSEQIAGFLLLPLYTQFLTPDDYGILSLVRVFTGFTGIIFMMGTSSSVFRFYRTSGDAKERQEACYSSLSLVSAWSLLVLLVIYPFREIVSVLLFDTNKYAWYVMIGTAAAAFTSISSIPMFILRAEERSTFYVVNNLLKMVIRVSLGITFVVILKRAALGALEASLITALLVTIFLVTHRMWKTRFGFNIPLLIKLLKYGSPLIVTGFGGIILNSADRYFLKEFTELGEVGIYAVGYMIGSAILILIAAFRNSWQPIMFSYSDRRDAGVFYGRVLSYYTAVMGFFWIIIVLFSREVVMLMTAENFWRSYTVIPLISLAYIFWGGASIVSAGIYTKDKTYNEMILIPMVAGLCVLFNYFLIMRWGMMGAAWATFLSYMSYFFIYAARAGKYVKIFVQWKNLSRLIILFGVTVYLGYLLQTENLLISLSLKFVILSIVALTLSRSRFYFKNEVNILLSKVKTKGLSV